MKQSSNRSSSRFSPVLSIEPGTNWQISSWLWGGYLLAVCGLSFCALPAVMRLLGCIVLSAGVFLEWQAYVRRRGARYVKAVRWENNQWSLWSAAGEWEPARLDAGKCRFLWGISLCWSSGGRPKRAVIVGSDLLDPEIRRFKVRLALENIA